MSFSARRMAQVAAAGMKSIRSRQAPPIMGERLKGMTGLCSPPPGRLGKLKALIAMSANSKYSEHKSKRRSGKQHHNKQDCQIIQTGRIRIKLLGETAPAA